MPPTPGARLGAYEVVGLLGKGGMGEVYRAVDTRLERQVAIKVLPEAVRADPKRVARFEREAKLLASLNHPGIAAIYGLEQANGEQFIVMELVEGQTLADRIARGPIPVQDALEVAKQIADALEAAHEAGVIHRDLKPANIKVRADGTVKVLDFGLAKALADDSAASPATLTDSPTITSPVGITDVGMLLGTVAYMSPEQANGRPADKRSDLWAFGCVFYEMLTGQRALKGKDIAETLSAVIHQEPAWSALPAGTPSAIRHLLQRCLQKDPKQRMRDAGDARLEINEALTAPTSGIQGTAVEQQAAAVSAPRWRMALGGAAAVLVGSAVVGTTVWLAVRPSPPRVARLTIAPTGTGALTIEGVDRDLVVSPDGARVIYVGNRGTQLFVRALDQLEPAPVATASRTLRGVFTAPDGQWVGFVEDFTALKKVAITGGAAVTLAAMDGASRGATWLPDETIVFATHNPVTGLQRLPAAGGEVTVLTRPDGARGEADHLWPERLPNRRAVLFTIMPTSGGLEAAQVAVLDLMSGTQTTLVRGGHHAHYVASGHLVYAAGATLRAVAFDLDRLVVRGTPVPVVPRLVTTTFGAGDYSVADDGTLVYVDASGGGVGAARTLVWVDRQGREEPLGAPPRAYQQPRVSPDGTGIVVGSEDQEVDLWRWDLPNGLLTQLTFESARDMWPVWTPDGQRLVFGSARAGGVYNLFWQAADGTGVAERLSESRNNQLPTGITPDGTQVLVQEQTPTRGRDLRLLTLGPARPPTPRSAQGHPEQSRGATSSGRGEPVELRHVTPLLETRFEEYNGVLSPDGRWLAYESNSSGQLEIYMRPFPAVEGGQWLVSTAGGTRPLWARSGRELFYLAPDGALMVVPVEPRGTVWHPVPPTKLLEGRYVFSIAGSTSRNYDVSPDGQRFLMIKAGGSDSTAAPPQIVVVQHFDEELKRLVPTN